MALSSTLAHNTVLSCITRSIEVLTLIMHDYKPTDSQPLDTSHMNVYAQQQQQQLKGNI
jgi:hypothetical protein